MRAIVWFRRDLRVHDQPALAAAIAECREVIPIFVFDEPLLRSRLFGSACVTFMLSCLEDLRRSLAETGLSLLWYHGDPIEEIVKASRETRAEMVYWNRDYEPAAIARDRAVERALAHADIGVRTFKDHVIFEAHEILGSSGDPLQRYGAYKERWWTSWRESAPAIIKVPQDARAKPVSAKWLQEPLPSPEDLRYPRATLAIPGGEREAIRRLRWFVKASLPDYATGRNRLNTDATSMLSPHFRFGTLSTRTAAHTALESPNPNSAGSRKNVLTWVDELVWRDFFQQVLFNFPRVADEPFRPKAGLPSWRTSKRLFEAWSNGQTGFPLIDAGMRQLNTTGWMHNRVRMVVASFLVKDLRLDWRLGEKYFMQQLLDADLAANNGNWQWCASTGTDAMPGYRIFNPALQAKKFDPDGAYIRRYIPELAKIPTKHIHQPELMSRHEQDEYSCRMGYDYPNPIVDHTSARHKYLRLARRSQ